eukprot:1154146-Pelagomonas_calceolata.AAC.1
MHLEKEKKNEIATHTVGKGPCHPNPHMLVADASNFAALHQRSSLRGHLFRTARLTGSCMGHLRLLVIEAVPRPLSPACALFVCVCMCTRACNSTEAQGLESYEPAHAFLTTKVYLTRVSTGLWIPHEPALDLPQTSKSTKAQGLMGHG